MNYCQSINQFFHFFVAELECVFAKARATATATTAAAITQLLLQEPEVEHPGREYSEAWATTPPIQDLMLNTTVIERPMGCRGIRRGRGRGRRRRMALDAVALAPGQESQANINPEMHQRVITMLPQPTAQLDQNYLIDLLTRIDDKFAAIRVS